MTAHGTFLVLNSQFNMKVKAPVLRRARAGSRCLLGLQFAELGWYILCLIS